jgi:hypothetical protein
MESETTPDLPDLQNVRMNDGSRRFAALPQKVLWHGVRDHAAKLPGAAVTDFLCDGITEAWISFSYQGQEFTINDQFGEYWFFVKDASCRDEVLRRVVQHFEPLLGKFAG